MIRSVLLAAALVLASCSPDPATQTSADTSTDTIALRTVVYEHEIPVPVAAAWTVFSDFGGFAEWNGLPITLEIVGDGIGMTRIMDIPETGRIAERLDLRDDANRKLGYSLVQGTPLGMVTYQAEVALSAVGDDRTLIQWHGQFSGGPDADLDQMAQDLTGSYQGMSQALGSFVAQRR